MDLLCLGVTGLQPAAYGWANDPAIINRMVQPGTTALQIREWGYLSVPLCFPILPVVIQRLQAVSDRP